MCEKEREPESLHALARSLVDMLACAGRNSSQPEVLARPTSTTSSPTGYDAPLSHAVRQSMGYLGSSGHVVFCRSVIV